MLQKNYSTWTQPCAWWVRIQLNNRTRPWSQRTVIWRREKWNRSWLWLTRRHHPPQTKTLPLLALKPTGKTLSREAQSFPFTEKYDWSSYFKVTDLHNRKLGQLYKVSNILLLRDKEILFVCDHSNNQPHKLILTNFGTRVFWRQILFRFLKGKITITV